MTQDSSHNTPKSSENSGNDPLSLLAGVTIRKAMPTDAEAIHALLRPYVTQRLLLARTEAEVIELTRHGFMAVRTDDGKEKCLGFAAVEIYSAKVMAISSSEEFFKNCGFDYSLPDQKKAFFCQLRPRHPH